MAYVIADVLFKTLFTSGSYDCQLPTCRITTVAVPACAPMNRAGMDPVMWACLQRIVNKMDDTMHQSTSTWDENKKRRQLLADSPGFCSSMTCAAHHKFNFMMSHTLLQRSQEEKGHKFLNSTSHKFLKFVACSATKCGIIDCDSLFSMMRFYLKYLRKYRRWFSSSLSFSQWIRVWSKFIFFFTLLGWADFFALLFEHFCGIFCVESSFSATIYFVDAKSCKANHERTTSL